jgi:hypothetical protein
MLGQQPWIFQSPGCRRPIGQRRDGQCALARRAAENRARQAGVQPSAKQVTFNGMDGPVSDKTPDFVKAPISITPATAR